MRPNVHGHAGSLAPVSPHGYGVNMTLRWRAESKQWVLVASLHTDKGSRVISERIDWTGAPEVEDLKRLATAIRRECESWLW